MPTLVVFLLIFIVVGIAFLLVNLLIGKLIRPHQPTEDKGAIYECGEPTIGSSWIQFDLRFYVVALLFVIFDVEMAFFFPWAVVFGNATKLSNPELTTEQRMEATANLTGMPQQPIDPDKVAEQIDSAQTLAWIAFFDILIFFGVLLVGFAYLWKRGDLDWVRSTASQT